MATLPVSHRIHHVDYADTPSNADPTLRARTQSWPIWLGLGSLALNVLALCYVSSISFAG